METKHRALSAVRQQRQQHHNQAEHQWGPALKSINQGMGAGMMTINWGVLSLILGVKLCSNLVVLWKV